MKDDTKLKESIATLANMTRQYIEKDLQIKDVNGVNARWTQRHGWHLKHNKDLNGDLIKANCWQDDYK